MNKMYTLKANNKCREHNMNINVMIKNENLDQTGRELKYITYNMQ